MPARKRKLQDDDEPLVPHGLVGQALDPVEADSSDSQSVEDSCESAQEPVNDPDQDPRLPKPPRSTAADKSAKPSSGQLLHWPKVKQQLGDGRARFTKKIAGVRARLQGSRHLGRISSFATSRVSQVREELKSVREHAIPELQKVRESAQVPAKVARLKQGISTTATNSKQVWQAWRTNTAPRVQTMRQSLSAGAKNRIASLRDFKAGTAPRFQAVQQQLSAGMRKCIEMLGTWKADAIPYVQTAKQRVSAGAKRSIEESRARIAKTAGRARKESQPLILRTAGIAEPQKTSNRDFRLRIRLAGLPLQMRIAIARAKLEWQLGHESVSRDSRLWSSVALGALAALLVMGLFSMARHLAQASLPSNRVSANSSREATESARSASILPRTLATAKAPVKKAVRRMSPENSAPKTAAAKPQVRRSSDSDYVAKDTYVYYGSRASK